MCDGKPVTYRYTEGGYSEIFEAATDEAATARARELIAKGDYEPCDRTWYVHAELGRAGPEGEYMAIEWLTRRIDPAEPACPEGEHQWADLCVRDPGGGVIVSDACGACGWTRVRDTWGTDRATGEQGVEVISYIPPPDFPRAAGDAPEPPWPEGQPAAGPDL